MHLKKSLLNRQNDNCMCLSPSTWPEVYTTGRSVHHHFADSTILYLQASKLDCLNSCNIARVKVVVHVPVTFCMCTRV